MAAIGKPVVSDPPATRTLTLLNREQAYTAVRSRRAVWLPVRYRHVFVAVYDMGVRDARLLHWQALLAAFPRMYFLESSNGRGHLPLKSREVICAAVSEACARRPGCAADVFDYLPDTAAIRSADQHGIASSMVSEGALIGVASYPVRHSCSLAWVHCGRR